MRQSGISTIISTILLVVITISLAGTAYLFVFGGLTSRISSVFSIIDVYEDMITVRNDGTAAITSFNVINLDDKPIDYLIVSNDPSLVGYWKFDDGIGSNTVDNSGKGNNGVFNGESFNDGTIYGANRIDGKFGKALYFDGSGSYPNGVRADFGNNIKLDGKDFTITMWIKPIPQNKYRFVYFKWRPNLYLMEDDSNWVFELDDGVYKPVSISHPIDNKWYFVAQRVKQNQEHKVWLFNETSLIATVERNDIATTTGSDGTNFQLSQNGWAGSNNAYYQGIIDEVRIFNRSLTEDEIKNEMQSSIPIIRPVASYSFEESGQYVNDTHIWVKGKYDKTLSFDGKDDVVNVSDNPSLRLTVFTIEMWLKSNLDVGSTTSQAIAMPAESYGDNYVFSWGHSDPNYQKSWAFRDTMGYWHGCIYKTTLQKNVWYHLVTTYDGNILKVYLNGNLDNSTQLSGITPETTSLGNLHMSRSIVPFNGTIDEVRIYNRALTAEEIKAEYKMGGIIKPGQSATIKLYPSTPLSKGFHKITICTSSMCNTGNINIV